MSQKTVFLGMARIVMRKRGPRYEKRGKSASAVVTRLPKPDAQKNKLFRALSQVGTAKILKGG